MMVEAAPVLMLLPLLLLPPPSSPAAPASPASASLLFVYIRRLARPRPPNFSPGLARRCCVCLNK